MFLALAFATLAALAAAAPTYRRDTTTPTLSAPYPYGDPAHPWTPAYTAGCDASVLPVPPNYNFPAYGYPELAVNQRKIQYATVARGVQEFVCKEGRFVWSGDKAE